MNEWLFGDRAEGRTWVRSGHLLLLARKSAMDRMQYHIVVEGNDRSAGETVVRWMKVNLQIQSLHDIVFEYGLGRWKPARKKNSRLSERQVALASGHMIPVAQ